MTIASVPLEIEEPSIFMGPNVLTPPVTPVEGEKLLLAKTAWSERYDSLGAGDDPRGNHEGLRRGAGHEAFNFKRARDGRYYGYFRAHGGPRGGKLNLSRIDNRSTGLELGGVTVIWVSRPPYGHLQVVGWYRNATVFEQTRWEDSPWRNALYSDNPEGRDSYVCSAPADESVRLPVDERERWKLPKSISTRMRRTDVLYPQIDGHSDRLDPWVKQITEIVERIENFKLESLPQPPDSEDREVLAALHGQGLSQDPEKRKFIEETAMDHAKRHFESEGYKVVDVSHNSPFDLRCEKGSEKLQVEVKGTSGDGTRIILTQREFNLVAPTGWVRVLYVLPEIIPLEGGGSSMGNPRIINPFIPRDYESEPISYFLKLQSD